MPAPGDVAAFDRFARLYGRCMPAADSGALEAGLGFAEREIERVIDVGGGTGRGVRAVDAHEKVVVDAARGMLVEARRRGTAAVQGGGATLPLRDESVDAILIVDALHHMRDREGVLAEARRVLRPGGVLVIREFDPGTFRGRLLAATEHLLGFDSRFFTAEALAGAVGDVGLDPRIPDRGFGYTVVGVR